MDRRDPFEEMNRMIEEMRRTMERNATVRSGSFPEFEVPGGDPDVRFPAFESSTSLRGDANVTVEPTEEGFVVLADLPGFEKDEIDVRLEGEDLVVTADRDVSEEAEGRFARRRRRAHERIAVPGDVVESEVSATYRNGVLEVVLPTRDSDSESSRIDVE